MMRVLCIAAALTAASSGLAQTPAPPPPRAGTPLVPEPVAPLVTLVTPDDYPLEALNLKQQGSVRFLLDIAPNGWVKDCTIVSTSLSESLDRTSCEIMKTRARFRPARDSSGRPVEGTYTQAITWRLTEDAAVRPLNAATGLWYACIQGEASKLVPSELTLDQIKERAFQPCVQLERLVETEMKAAEIPAGATVTLKEQFRRSLRVFMTDARDKLRKPAGEADGRSVAETK